MGNPTITERLADELASTGQFDRALTLPSIRPPSKTPESLLDAVKAIKAILDAREGTSGSVMDKSLTMRDLIDAGAIQIQLGGRTIGGGGSPLSFSSSPAGGWVDPRPYLGSPPAPTSLVGAGSFRSVFLSWELSSYSNHAYVQVFRATSNSRGSAVIIGTSLDNMYVDSTVSASTAYWYWVKAVGVDLTGVAIYGDDNAVGGTSAGAQLVGNVDLGPLIIEAENLAFDSVNGDHLAVDSIAAGTLAVGIGAITSAMINDLTATKITAGLTSSVHMEAGRYWGSEFYIGGSPSYSYSVLVPGGPSVKVAITGVSNPNVALTSSGAMFNSSYFKIWNGASEEAPFEVVGGVVKIKNANIGIITAGMINSNGLSIRDWSGKVILSAGVPLPASYSTEADFQAERAWNFNGGVEGWYNINATNLTFGPSSMTVTATSSDPHFRSPGISIYGAAYNKVRARIRRRTAAYSTEATCYFTSVAQGSYGVAGQKDITNPCVTVDEWVVAEWDMAALNDGGTGWTGNTITSIRLDLGSYNGDIFEIDWIAIGGNSPSSYGAEFGRNVFGKITADTAATYIENAAIDIAQIKVASIGSLSALSATIGTLEASPTGQRSRLSDAGLQIFNSFGTEVITLGIF